MDYKDFALDLAKKAGGVIRSNFSLDVKKEWKVDNSPVTETDKSINKMVIDAVAENFPGHSVLGEEESNLIEGSEYTWVCDPVDGTVPFSHGIPTCVFSLALVQKGIPIIGVIYDPFMDRLFYAEKGSGAFLNGNKIHVNNSNMNHSVISWESKTVSYLKAKYPANTFMSLYTICYEGALVACGSITAAYYGGKWAHDVAALKVIVEEAGGKVTDRDGNEQAYDRNINGALISNGVVHDELLEFIKTNSK
jgi:myo-inositol-1(or 4)-monophosphatase